MHKYIFIKILLAALTILPVVVFSQIPLNRPGGEIQETQRPDEKEVTPLIKKWKIEGFGTFKDSVKLDTMLDYYHIYNPAFKDAITTTYVGNYGTPYLNNNFFKRDPGIDFFFLGTREAYLLTPEKIEYYNTRTPYTMLDFSQSENKSRKNETRFNVLHSQNVNPYLNFTFRYDQARSAGQYKNQDSKNNFVTLYSNYNKDKLSIHGGFITNSIQNSENGGLENDSLIFSGDDTDLLNVNLTSTRSEFSSNYFFATGEYRLGKYIETGEERIIEPEEGEEEKVIQVKKFKPLVGFIYSFEYQTHLKEFIDNEDTTSTFFRNTFYSNDYIKDSVRFRMLQNIFQIKQYENPERKTSFGKRAFIGQQHVVNSFPRPQEGIKNIQRKSYSNIYAGGGIFRETGSFWRWNFEGRIYLLGRRSGQTELSGIIKKPLKLFGDSASGLSINGRIENRVPEFYQQEFYSNHSQWKNNLNSEQRMTARGRIESPLRNLYMGFNYSLINNFIYNDSLGVPSQFGGQLLVLGAHIDKDFNYRGLHFRTRLLWQKASNERILHLPEFSAFVSAYYSFIISKVMHARFGIDTRYNTKYYADAYDVSTGLFHLQNEKELGDFPYIDAHVNLQLKRTQVFFKMMNIGTEFIDREYFTTPHYPMNRRTFRFGVAWAFYD